jgi:hypothetical protein
MRAYALGTDWPRGDGDPAFTHSNLAGSCGEPKRLAGEHSMFKNLLVPLDQRFAAARLAVLLFDYRHFGESGGQPRQLIDIRQQLEDYRAAIRFA